MGAVGAVGGGSFDVGSGNAFNATRFNKVFDEHKLEDAHDAGYGSFMTQSTPKREDIDIANKVGSFDVKRFNKAFDKLPTTKESKVIVFKEPEPLVSCKGIAFSELGLASITDFSGDNMDGKRIMYSDYKVAHTTSKLVDPRVVKQRKEYASVRDLEADRDNVSYTMTEKEQAELARHAAKQDALERKRLEQVKRRDEAVFKQHEQLNRLLLGRS